MSRTRSDRFALRRLALALLPVGAILVAEGGAAQEEAVPAGNRIVSHEVSISRNAATLKLELSDGRAVDFAVEGGRALLNGTDAGAVERGGTLDRSWRDLLNGVIDARAEDLPRLLDDWSAEGDVGSALDTALEQAVAGTYDPAAPVSPAPISDSLSKLQERIAELEAERAEEVTRVEHRMADGWDREGRWRPGPLHYLTRGFSHLMSLVVLYVILLIIGIATIVFGGRKYIEGVADTVRHATMRSFLVGLAGAFLTLPAFVLGIIALAISIIGIPGLLAWIPGFPLAVAVALLLGYIAVAHAAGESLAERRYSGAEWFQRSNSYYFLISGIGLLLAFFIAGAAVSMVGPWLGFITGLLRFFAVIVTLVAFCTGFGAVLLSRAGTRPIRANGKAAEPDLFTDPEEAGV